MFIEMVLLICVIFQGVFFPYTHRGTGTDFGSSKVGSERGALSFSSSFCACIHFRNGSFTESLEQSQCGVGDGANAY